MRDWGGRVRIKDELASPAVVSRPVDALLRSCPVHFIIRATSIRGRPINTYLATERLIAFVRSNANCRV